MKLTINNFETLFFLKQDELREAIERCECLEYKYRKHLPNWKELYNWDFNLIYDLRYRLENRLKDLQSEYYSLHWDKHGFNIY